uniref:Uncharacterized protein n=1 Tax=Arundo donax TaxID=35708 RepID=A0A0A9QCN6_ARUDO
MTKISQRITYNLLLIG